MPETYTQRGFPVYAEFTDYDGDQITVSASSLATDRAVRVYVHGTALLCEPPRALAGREHGMATADAGAHLTRDQAIRLRDALIEFIDEGLTSRT